MINSIRIKNFQSHKDTYVEFSDRVNIFVGSSDSGKTALAIRALNWVINNKPSGDSFRSNWGGDTSVVVKLDDGNTIERIKTNKDNLYILNGLEFRSFGQDVPEEIKKVINISDVNFQYQMDAPFLLSKSPGEVARYLNKIVNLDEIDLSISNISSLIRKTNQEKEFKENQLTNLKEEKEKYDWLNSAERLLKRAEKLEEEIIEGDKEHKEISLLIADIDIEEEKKDRVNNILKSKRLVNQAIFLDEKVKELGESSYNINRDVKEIEEIENRIKDIDKFLLCRKDIENALKLSNEIELLERESLVLKMEIHNINKLKNRYISIVSELEELRKEFNLLMPDICPLCGR